MSTSPSTLVLHSSTLRWGIQALTPVLLLALGFAGLGGDGWIVPVVLLVLGGASAVVVVLDLPLRSEFTDDGVTRVCVLRRHHLPWSGVVAVERAHGRPGRAGDDGARVAAKGRGLVARTGPRRVHLLVDRGESQAEWATLRSLLGSGATQLRAGEPQLDATPAGRGSRALHRQD